MTTLTPSKEKISWDRFCRTRPVC